MPLCFSQAHLLNMKITSNVLYIVLCAVLFVSVTRADEVDDYVKSQMRERHVPGAAIAVIKSGKIVKMQGYGLANTELNVPVTKDTVFEIGSVSKQMTAAGIMLLVQDGKINLDEKISKYLPNTPENWKDVTTRHLLTHTSGIKSYTGLSGYELSKRLTRDEFIKQLSIEPLDFPTGDKYSYSNSGYSLLGYIIETVSGKSYWDFMRERIFAPLGMTKTADRDPQFIVPNRADGYEWRNNRYVGRDWDLTDIFSAGAIVSTIEDMTKWEAAMAGDKFLKPETKNQMWTAVKFNDGTPYNYGFGWMVALFRAHKLISHSGQTAGFAANISRFVDDNVTVIVLTNNGEQGLGTLIARGIAKIHIPAIALRSLKAVPLTNRKMSQMFETALQSRIANNIKKDLFTDEMQKSLETTRAKTLTEKIANYKSLDSFMFVGNEKSGTGEIYRYLAKAKAHLMLWRFAVSQEGKISEMTLEEEE